MRIRRVENGAGHECPFGNLVRRAPCRQNYAGISQRQERRDLLISAVVYAESIANPYMSESIAKSFFLATGVGIDFELSEAVWTETGRRFRRYAQRRRQSGGDEARRLLADFVVGSHALLQADRLMTLDERRYRTDFRELQLYDLGI